MWFGFFFVGETALLCFKPCLALSAASPRSDRPVFRTPGCHELSNLFKTCRSVISAPHGNSSVPPESLLPPYLRPIRIYFRLPEATYFSSRFSDLSLVVVISLSVVLYFRLFSFSFSFVYIMVSV